MNQMLDDWMMVDRQKSDIRHRISDIRHRTSDIGHRTSDIGHRTSDILKLRLIGQLPAGSINILSSRSTYGNSNSIFLQGTLVHIHCST